MMSEIVNDSLLPLMIHRFSDTELNDINDLVLLLPCFTRAMGLSRRKDLLVDSLQKQEAGRGSTGGFLHPLGRRAAPGDKALVLEPGLAVGERGAGEGFDSASGRFENRLPGGSIPLHRRAETGVDIGFPRGDDAE